MNEADDLAEAVRKVIDEGAFKNDTPVQGCDCECCELVKALSRYDAAKPVRDAERKLLKAAENHLAAMKFIRQYPGWEFYEADEALQAARAASNKEEGK